MSTAWTKPHDDGDDDDDGDNQFVMICSKCSEFQGCRGEHSGAYPSPSSKNSVRSTTQDSGNKAKANRALDIPACPATQREWMCRVCIVRDSTPSLKCTYSADMSIPCMHMGNVQPIGDSTLQRRMYS